MANELVTQDPRDIADAAAEREPTAINFAERRLGPGVNQGAVAVESERAIAETQGKMILAKRFPRSIQAAIAEFLESCKDPDFAAAAFYAVPNRGSGPSIRFAEEAARCYGNFDFGHKELSRETGDGTPGNPGKSEIEVYAWDMEKNNYSRRQVTVLHVQDSKSGGARPLKDQADIDNRIANVASKQMRGRILAIVSKALVSAGIRTAKATIAGSSDKPMTARIQNMVQAFGKHGVTAAHLEAYLKHQLDHTTVDELADLHGIALAIKEGTKPSEFFPMGDAEEEKKPGQVAGARPEPKTQTKPKDDPKPKEEPKPKEADAPKEEAKPQAQADGPKEEPKPADPPAAQEGEKTAAEASNDAAGPEAAGDGAPAAEGQAEGAPGKDLF